MMKALFDTDFIVHYGITTKSAVAVEHIVKDRSFDLYDKSNPPIVPAGKGQLSVNTSEDVDILEYEKFINSCKAPRSFSNGRKRCDYLMTTHTTNSAVCLIEMTSATGSASKLSLPIRDKKGNVIYPGGKTEKVEDQLSQSLQTMLTVPSIQSDFAARNRKICLMSYVVYPYTSLIERLRHPLMRFLGIESQEVGNDGAIISCPSIEAMGFEYRRISHSYAFKF